MKIRISLAVIALCFGTARAQEPGAAAIYPQLGHSGGIHAVAFSPDGRYLASGASDKMIRIWDARNGREVRTLIGRSDVVSSVAFSPDGKLLATGDWDRTVTLWDVASGRALRTFGGGPGVVWSLAFSRDGNWLASASSNRIPSDFVASDSSANLDNVELWNVASGARRALYTGTSSYTAGIAFSANGKELIADGIDGMPWWDLASGRIIRTIAGKAKPFSALALSPNGKLLASGGASDATLWNAADGRVLRKISTLYEQVTSVAFSPDGKLLATGTYDHGVTLWNTASGARVRVIVEGQGMYGTHVAFSPDGKALVSVADEALELRDVANGRLLRTFGRRVAQINAVAWSADRKLIASGGDDNSLKLWDAASGRELRRFAGHTNFIEAVAFSRDGSLLASAAADDTVRLWDVATGSALRILRDLPVNVSCMAFSPDGTTIASGSNIGGLILWDVAGGRELRKISNSGDASGIAFSPDGKTIATVGQGTRGIKFWDVASGTLLRTLGGATEEEIKKAAASSPILKMLVDKGLYSGIGQGFGTVAFSPDGKLLAVAGTDKTIEFWDVASGQVVRTLSGHSDWVGTVAFSPDGETLVSGSNDDTVKLWNVASGETLRTFEGHLGIVTSVAFASDGKTLVSGSWDGTVRLWDPATGKERASLVSFTDGSSIAVTPEGFFDSSSEDAEENLNVRIGARVFGIASFREHFYRPDLVTQGLAGEPLTQFGSIDTVKLSPIVEFAGLPATTSQSTLKLNLHLTNGGGGFGPVRVFWNGTVIEQDSDLPEAGDSLTRPYTVPLFPGANELRVSALNADGTMFSDTSASIIANLPAPAKISSVHGTLRALIVGIAHFPNAPHNDLTYPGADAQLIAQTLTEKAAPLFAKLDIRTLAPAETDKAHVIQAFKAMQAAAGPDDEFVFYAASHGIVVGGEYYLLAADAGAPDAAGLKAGAISSAELSDLLANIRATRKLVIIDTCDAGGALPSSGFAARDAVTILGRSFGLTVLAATTSDQEALEGGYKNHGLFTYVVADGLGGRAADTKSGIVSSFLLADYVNAQVPLLAETALHRAQQPTADKSGQSFAVTKVK